MSVHPVPAKSTVRTTSVAAKRLPAPLQAFDSAVNRSEPTPERRVSMSVEVVLRAPPRLENDAEMPPRVRKACYCCITMMIAALWGFTIYAGYKFGYNDAMRGTNCTRT